MFPAWLVIAVVGVAIASASSLLSSRDIKWFKRQRRPDWLTFEFAIPVVWTVVFICGGWSAYIVWSQTQSWWFMAGYVLLELLIMSYTPVMCKLQSLRVGMAIGGCHGDVYRCDFACGGQCKGAAGGCGRQCGVG